MSDQTTDQGQELSDYDEEQRKLAEEAMTADTRPDRPYRVYGQVVTMDMWPCVLESGKGKRMYNPGKDDPNKKSIAIDIHIQDVISGSVHKQDYVDWSSKWKSVTLPSLKAINLHILSLNNTYVCIEYAPTGRLYKDKAGVEKKEKTFKFLETFPDRDSCEAAARMSSGTDEDDIPADDTNTAQSSPQSSVSLSTPDTNGINAATMALQAVKAMWNASGKNQEKFEKMFAKNPAVNKHFVDANAAIAALD